MVRVEGDSIVEVGSYDGSDATDLGDVVLMPGLINAHCHLDYTLMRGAILPNSSFSRWIRRINDLKRVVTDEAYLDSIAAGFAELAASGTTTVLNFESFPELMVRLPPPPLRTWWFYELLDIRSRIHTEDVVAGALSFFDSRPGWPGGFGLAPHAPYTASSDLYRLARFCCEKNGMPFMTHLAESDEELAMFEHGSGPLHQFLSGLGRDMSDTGGRSPVQKLLESESLPDGALLAHMNLLSEDDWARLRGRRYSIVHCPGCHEYFARAPFPIERFLAEGFNVCLGTDSLASNRWLNMFGEMRLLRQNHPSVSEDQILDMTTRNAAAAIGMSGRLGEIRTGAFADMIAVRYSGSLGDAVAAVLAHEGNVEWSMVAGQRVIGVPPTSD
jgi:cytosine/adenosine deaminase-related metal-dependent hydrolase